MTDIAVITIHIHPDLPIGDRETDMSKNCVWGGGGGGGGGGG